ncbi:cathelicidin-2-like [Catharus ustulatus]|uniref:cathelicidin-2-like n=1 Tax=Catharus ustulatus TaxID=91951 RepID=UPI00140AEDCB|nr:cathelicidin-2-like [Catharus ustulatus]
MASSWMLLLAVLGGACALPAPEPFAYTQALAQAVNSYNQRPEVKNAFRLLSAEPQPEPGVELSSLQAFNFSMMETECAASARSDPEDCDFKENGIIRECVASLKMLKEFPEIDLKCSDPSSDISSDISSDEPSDVSEGSRGHPLPGLVERGGFGRSERKINFKFRICLICLKWG